MFGFLHLRSCPPEALRLAVGIVSPLISHDQQRPCDKASMAGFRTVVVEHSWPAGPAGPPQKQVRAKTIPKARLSRTADDMGQGRVANPTHPVGMSRQRQDRLNFVIRPWGGPIGTMATQWVIQCNTAIHCVTRVVLMWLLPSTHCGCHDIAENHSAAMAPWDQQPKAGGRGVICRNCP